MYTQSTVQFGDFFVPRQIVGVLVNVTESFDASTSAVIKGGTSSGASNIFAGVDVTTSGEKFADLGGASYTNNQNCYVTLEQSGTPATKGKACVVIYYVIVPTEPA